MDVSAFVPTSLSTVILNFVASFPATTLSCPYEHIKWAAVILINLVDWYHIVPRRHYNYSWLPEIRHDFSYYDALRGQKVFRATVASSFQPYFWYLWGYEWSLLTNAENINGAAFFQKTRLLSPCPANVLLVQRIDGERGVVGKVDIIRFNIFRVSVRTRLFVSNDYRRKLRLDKIQLSAIFHKNFKSQWGPLVCSRRRLLLLPMSPMQCSTIALNIILSSNVWR